MLPLQRDAYSTPFFEAAAASRLVIRRCTECGHASAPAAQRCGHCYHESVVWEEASRRGTLLAWSAAASSEPGRPPEVVGLVELAEGPWLHAGGTWSEDTVPQVGADCEIRFSSVDGGEHLPTFMPTHGA